jgi:hypothetical protein
MSQVKIGPSFFKKAKNDYADWRWALVREFYQNSADAGSNRIDFDIQLSGGDTVFTVYNNGDVMTENILVNKLLALGESGKNFEGSVGGFGKAKELCYYCHKSYDILTGSIRVTGSGANYDLGDAPYYDGTRSTIIMDGDEVDALCRMVRRFARLCQWRGKLTLNGEHIETSFRKGRRRRDFEWGTIYTNNQVENILVARINGIPMFVKRAEAGGKGIVIELTGASNSVLQSSRDGLLYEYSCELEEFVRQLTVDKRSALRDQYQGPTYTKYSGNRLQAKNEGHTLQELITAAYAAVSEPAVEDAVIEREMEAVEEVVEDGSVNADEGQKEDTVARPELSEIEVKKEKTIEVKRPMIGHEFIIKNDLGMTIPKHYTPESFSDYSKRLVRCWAACLLEVHAMIGEVEPFSVGFIFEGDENESTQAEFEQSGDFGRVYYVNPVRIARNRFTGRSLAKRWKFDKPGKMALLADAVHEVCHSQCRFSGHDEIYAGKLTDMMAIAFAQYDRFHKCFSQK